MKGILIGISILLATPFAFSQQIAQYSQWSFNQFAINPALAGVKRCLDVRTAYRMQWAGFEGAPQSGLFTINAPIKMQRKSLSSPFHGIGGKIERDVFGDFHNISISLAYALHFPMGRDKMLSFGVSGGVQQFGFDHTQASTIEPDPAVAQSASNFLFPLIGFGGWYNSEKFYAGISMDQLAMNKWTDIGLDSRFRLHTKIQMGTKYTFDNKNSLLPGILVRIPPAGPVSFDINAMLDFQNNFLVGLGYRNIDAFIGFFRVRIKQISIGYSFDFITSDIRGGNFHTHELSIHFNGCQTGKRSTSACPLFE
ncbi:MAG: PorP/SprF family type IX secretion system membrane protein [Brumimicrobium sp.]|nr:PorP/SprF family type IX secretion system membrane protein [Brumimicrobium sp.]